MRYSEEFTSWVSLWVQWDYSSETQKADIEQFLADTRYEMIFDERKDYRDNRWYSTTKNYMTKCMRIYETYDS